MKFFFVNSRETADNKLEAVTELMEEGSYPFHVLMDVKDEVFGSYEISFLPTKIFTLASENGLKLPDSFNLFSSETLKLAKL